jgi:hypothetical protein
MPNAFVFRGRISDTRGSDALGSSMLDCRVYAKHKIRRDSFIGGTRGTIESLLAEGASGG